MRTPGWVERVQVLAERQYWQNDKSQCLRRPLRESSTMSFLPAQDNQEVTDAALLRW